MKELGTAEMPGLCQLFIEKNSTSKTVIIVAKVMDDLILVGTLADLNTFHDSIAQKF